jgi:hypothetical protein
MMRLLLLLACCLPAASPARSANRHSASFIPKVVRSREDEVRSLRKLLLAQRYQ